MERRFAPKKAAAALFWAMDEMDRRYRLMKDKGARNIDNYNRTLEREAAHKKSVIELTEPEEPNHEPGGHPAQEAPLVHEKLPRIVIVVSMPSCTNSCAAIVESRSF